MQNIVQKNINLWVIFKVCVKFFSKCPRKKYNLNPDGDVKKTQTKCCENTKVEIVWNEVQNVKRNTA